MVIVYDLLFIVFAVLYLPYTIVRGKWHPGFKMRMGRFTFTQINAISSRRNIWFHAVSVGEVLAVSHLIKKLHKIHPQYDLICSTVTTTGHAVASKQIGGICRVLYAPLDFSHIVRKYISIIQPKVYVSTETEIWPNLYTALHERKVPIIQVNGRLSDRSFRNYWRFRFIMRRVLACVSKFCMQGELDAKRIIKLGADPHKVKVVGNLKFDLQHQSSKMSRRDLGIENNAKVVIAGSTHPGEEAILLDAYKEMLKTHPGLRLILAPRHIERTREVTQLITNAGFKPLQFTMSNGQMSGQKSVIVVDTIGQLSKLYELADIVFIGKTLLDGGGQNMIEPAAAGKAVIIGPKAENFKEAVSLLRKAGAIIEVQDSRGLLKEMDALLNDPRRAEDIGQKAKRTVQSHQGATDTTIKAISGFLNGNAQ